MAARACTSLALPACPGCSQQRPAKAHPPLVWSELDLQNHLESYFATRPISYPTQLQSILWPCSRVSQLPCAGLWKVSDGEDNEGTCLRCRRRGARNRSGQECRPTSHGCESRSGGYGAGAAAAKSCTRREGRAHARLDDAASRPQLLRSRSRCCYERHEARRSSARPSG